MDSNFGLRVCRAGQRFSAGFGIHHGGGGCHPCLAGHASRRVRPRRARRALLPQGTGVDEDPRVWTAMLHDLQRERRHQDGYGRQVEGPPERHAHEPGQPLDPQQRERRDDDQGQREGDDGPAARPMCRKELGMRPEEIEERLCDRQRPERAKMRTPLENRPSPPRRSRAQVETPPRLPTTTGHRADASETNPIPTYGSHPPQACPGSHSAVAQTAVRGQHVPRGGGRIAAAPGPESWARPRPVRHAAVICPQCMVTAAAAGGASGLRASLTARAFQGLSPMWGAAGWSTRLRRPFTRLPPARTAQSSPPRRS